MCLVRAVCVGPYVCCMLYVRACATLRVILKFLTVTRCEGEERVKWRTRPPTSHTAWWLGPSNRRQAANTSQTGPRSENGGRGVVQVRKHALHSRSTPPPPPPSPICLIIGPGTRDTTLVTLPPTTRSRRPIISTPPALGARATRRRPGKEQRVRRTLLKHSPSHLHYLATLNL